MSEHTDHILTLFRASDTLDELGNELLFLSVAIGHAWDDHPTMGCVLIIDRLRDTLKTVSAKIRDVNSILRQEEERRLAQEGKL